MKTLGDDSLICAFQVSPQGKAKQLNGEQLSVSPNSKGWTWIHLERTSVETKTWLTQDNNIPPTAVSSLLAEETRPGIKAFADGYVINLRGINLNSSEPDEDLVAVRLWVTPGRVISLRRYKLMAVQDLRDKYENGTGPASIGAFIAALCNGLAQRISGRLNSIEDSLDELEELSIERPNAQDRSALMDIRRKSIPLKRFLTPQRDALEELSRLDVKWLSQIDRENIRESFHHLSRIIELLDAIRERATLLHEEMANRNVEIANNNTYVLTIVAAIFLPLGFLTGLLGINVGGVPGMDNPWSFIIVCILMLVIGILEIIILKWLKWI